MKSLYLIPRPLPLRTRLRHSFSPHLALRTSATASTRSIEVPTSRAIAEQGSFSVIEKCPAPTCVCAKMPTDLDIDYKKPLRGTMPHYTRHVVIHTAQNDWESRIEDGAIGRGREKSVNLARELKELIGPKGKYHNVCRSLVNRT